MSVLRAFRASAARAPASSFSASSFSASSARPLLACRGMCDAAGEAPPRALVAPVSQGWSSKARATTATGKHNMIKISPRKLREILRPIRNLSVSEALAQLKFHPRKKAIFVHNAIRTASKQAVNQFQMDPDRLVVSHLNGTKGRFLKRIRYHAKGKHGILFKYYAHLTVSVSEKAPVVDEDRLGHYGRKHATIRNTMDRLQQLKQAREAASAENSQEMA